MACSVTKRSHGGRKWEREGEPGSRGAAGPGHSAGFLPRPPVRVSQDLPEFLPSGPEGSSPAQAIVGPVSWFWAGLAAGPRGGQAGHWGPHGPFLCELPLQPRRLSWPLEGLSPALPLPASPMVCDGYSGVWLLSFTPQCSGTPTPAFRLSNWAWAGRDGRGRGMEQAGRGGAGQSGK